MTKEEMKNKYSAFITEISEILGLGKPVDILKLCATTDLFFRPLEKRVEELENDNAELKKKVENLQKYLDTRNCYRECAETWLKLTKAKELIKTLLLIVDNKVSQMEFQLCVADAKQFISEVEK